ncbi:glycosyltransferase family 2 protein [Thalassomonas viridans]|uniref:Glycosyltransferase family 2 protein n=1 Tax=Thalassomonas viridans TaxID=137584 RepID=A0AAF0CCE3_9GAMM|nr:glycosyltransferase family 2 protein [Thalassomonas viridans]WDE08041.1 glycosyltransferase family 2 protein [Thalassomonas viridans]
MNKRHSFSVSVIIPCFNAQASISDAVASARRQQNVDLEIICINDHSSDTCPQILSALASQGEITYLNNEHDKGAANARNLGLENARGEYIQFLDADDLLLENKLCRQIGIMVKNNADFVAGAYQYQNLSRDCSMHYPDPDPWLGLIASKFGRTSANLFRKSALVALGGWSARQKSSQEYELMYRLLKNNQKPTLDNQPGALICATPGSISQSNLLDNSWRFIELRTRIIDYLKATGQLTQTHLALYSEVCRRSRDEVAHLSDKPELIC